LEKVINQPTLDFGKEMRELSTQQLGNPLNDSQFADWRKEIADNGTVKHEYEIDRTLWAMAINDAIQNGKAIVAGKGVSFLKDRMLKIDIMLKEHLMLKEEETLVVVAIGISTKDYIATERYWKKEHKESDTNPSKEDLDAIAERRYNRLQYTKRIFAAAYPYEIPNYSHDSVLRHIHYIFDNTPDRTAEEMHDIVVEFLIQLAVEVPSLATVLTKFLSFKVEE
jgi:hypothetical protein